MADAALSLTYNAAQARALTFPLGIIKHHHCERDGALDRRTCYTLPTTILYWNIRSDTMILMRGPAGRRDAVATPVPVTALPRRRRVYIAFHAASQRWALRTTGTPGRFSDSHQCWRAFH